MRDFQRRGFWPSGVIFCAFFTFAGISGAGVYSGGAGTAEDPYNISTVADWQELIATSADWNRSFVLLNDIDFVGVKLTPISPHNDPTEAWQDFHGIPFTGVFDGSGHILRNVVIYLGRTDFVGLFGSIGNGSQIRNLGMENFSITGRENVGGLCGNNDRGKITGCYTTGPITGKSYIGGLCGNSDQGTISGCYTTGGIKGNLYYVGGLCGKNKGTISLCYATGTVTGNSDVGGLCGLNYGGIIQSCATGSVTGDDSVGGLCGNNDHGTISGCYAIGSVKGSWDYVGGLCGENYKGTISRCYATGEVMSGGKVGGLCGNNASDAITESFWDIETSGQPTSSGGSGRTTQELHDINTYLGVGWDFGNDDRDPADWILQTVSYPILAWQIPNLYSGGSGTIEDPYRIATKADLLALASQPLDYSISFILTDDIDLNDTLFTTAIIARVTDSNNPGFQVIDFSGIIDGNGHRIMHLAIHSGGTGYLGLIGWIGATGQVKNLGVDDCTIDGGNYIGGLCGYNDQGTIVKCFVTGAISGSDHVGGLCGENRGTVSQCNVVVTVKGVSDVGGLCGISAYSAIHGCDAAGLVSGSGNQVGGLCGYNMSSLLVDCSATGPVMGRYRVGGLCGENYESTIHRCYTTGEVTADDIVGGLCGANWNGTITLCYATNSVNGGNSSQYLGGLCASNVCSFITSCYASGSVKGGTSSQYVGGFCGYTDRGIINSCVWDIQASERSKGVGYGSSSGVIGKTTAEMKALSTFTSAGWDFVGESANGTADVWRMCADGISYPRLSWEFSQGGDMDCPDGVAMEDLLYLAGRWMAGTPETVGAADLNGDGRVDLADFALFAEQWMK